MTRALLAILLLAALAASGCATVPASVAMSTAQALVAAEGSVDAAEVVATAALVARVPLAVKNAAEIARLSAPCAAPTAPNVSQCPIQGTLILAQKAQAASDTTSMATLAANLTAFAVELGTLH